MPADAPHRPPPDDALRGALARAVRDGMRRVGAEPLRRGVDLVGEAPGEPAAPQPDVYEPQPGVAFGGTRAPGPARAGRNLPRHGFRRRRGFLPAVRRPAGLPPSGAQRPHATAPA